MSEIVDKMRKIAEEVYARESPIFFRSDMFLRWADALESAERRVAELEKLHNQAFKLGIEWQQKANKLESQLAQKEKPVEVDWDAMGKICWESSGSNAERWNDLVSPAIKESYRRAAKAVIAAYTSQTGGESSGD